MINLFALLLCSVLHFSPPVTGQAQAAGRENLIHQGFDRMYDLDFAGAHRDFDQWEQQHPQDPLGPVAQGAAYLFTEFERLGVLQTQLFTDDIRYENRRKQTPDPQLKQKFDAELDHGDALAAKVLEQNPSDVNAKFAQVLALGLRSDYAALVENRDIAAIRYTKQGRVLAESLLQQQPKDYDAYLAVGVENYLSGIKPAPVRWLLSMGGVQTDKQQGLRDLQLTASQGDLLAPFARLLLAVAALRDHEQSKACQLLGGLQTEFPNNPLYRQERGVNHC